MHLSSVRNTGKKSECCIHFSHTANSFIESLDMEKSINKAGCLSWQDMRKIITKGMDKRTIYHGLRESRTLQW